MPPPSALFETHLDVRDLERSVAFYRDVVGLEFAFGLPERYVAFLWVRPAGIPWTTTPAETGSRLKAAT